MKHTSFCPPTMPQLWLGGLVLRGLVSCWDTQLQLQPKHTYSMVYQPTCPGVHLAIVLDACPGKGWVSCRSQYHRREKRKLSVECPIHNFDKLWWSLISSGSYLDKNIISSYAYSKPSLHTAIFFIAKDLLVWIYSLYTPFWGDEFV